jgi:hypothetical protein
MVTNTTEAKAAVKRLRRELKTLPKPASELSHSDVQQLLARTLGYKNWDAWRATLETLHEVREPGSVTQNPANAKRHWLVDAQWADTGREYRAWVEAATPLGAAITFVVGTWQDVSDSVLEFIRDVDGNEQLRFLPQVQPEVPGIGSALYAVREAAEKVPVSDDADFGTVVRWLGEFLAQNDESAFVRLFDIERVCAASTGDDASESVPIPGTEIFPTDGLRLICEHIEQAHGGIERIEEDNRVLAVVLHTVRAAASYAVVLDMPLLSGLQMPGL